MSNPNFFYAAFLILMVSSFVFGGAFYFILFSVKFCLTFVLGWIFNLWSFWEIWIGGFYLSRKNCTVTTRYQKELATWNPCNSLARVCDSRGKVEVQSAARTGWQPQVIDGDNCYRHLGTVAEKTEPTALPLVFRWVPPHLFQETQTPKNLTSHGNLSLAPTPDRATTACSWHRRPTLAPQLLACDQHQLFLLRSSPTIVAALGSPASCYGFDMIYIYFFFIRSFSFNVLPNLFFFFFVYIL